MYIKRHCSICNKLITVSGFATVSHLRKHVREGVLIERTIDARPSFVKDLTELESQPRARHYF